MIDILYKNNKIASFQKENRNFIIDYNDFDIKHSITLSMPNTKKFYIYDYKFPPYFESFLPEGYLYEIFKNLLSKEYGKVDDYLIFNLLSSNIQSRISFRGDIKDKVDFVDFDIDDILQNDTNDTFSHLLQTFLDKNAISGVQPKTIALLKDKENLDTKEYIIKTWGDEYQDLSLNEYFCLKIVEKAGVKIPNIKLSKNNKFLIVEKFNLTDDKKFLGFEEILSLMDKNKDSKYDGSYEQVAKIIYSFATNKSSSMVAYYKTVVMNYLLKNGDAHLKNFGLLFSDDFSNIFYAPAYDIVNTVVYIHKDKPALMLEGKKVWYGKDELINFGQLSCLLTKNETIKYYDECKAALVWGINELENYIGKNPDFKIGKMMLDSWRLSLDETTTKEIPIELIRSWKDY
jgi:serine/threonine-protein kinase HipA